MTLQGLGKPPGCKLIRFTAELNGNRIERIQIRGDFFAVPEEAFEGLETELRGTDLSQVAERFTELAEKFHIELQGITGTGLAELLMAAWMNRSSNHQSE